MPHHHSPRHVRRSPLPKRSLVTLVAASLAVPAFAAGTLTVTASPVDTVSLAGSKGWTARSMPDAASRGACVRMLAGTVSGRDAARYAACRVDRLERKLASNDRTVDVTAPQPAPEPEPVTEPVTAPVTEPVTEPVTAPVTEPVTEPVAEPVAESDPATELAPATQPTGQTGGPHGVPGAWVKAWGDEFNGTSLDLTEWESTWFGGGEMNNVSTSTSNVTVANGAVRLQLSSPSEGALIHTAEGADRYAMKVGEVVEARVWFPGNGADLYNWPAFWANDTYDDTRGMAVGGEHDIAEVLSSHDLTVNYHSPSGAHNQGSVSGYWGDQWHVYTLHRKAGSADVYFDGRLVKSYSTDDSGAPLDVIFNVGALSDDVSGVSPVTGPEGALRVDWVRAYKPAAQ
jgi:hypothetical protein